MGKIVIVRLADNIPVTIRAKYCDLFPGEHGPQVRFKGAVEGGEANAAIYIDAAAGLRELTAIGAIAGAPKGYDPENVSEQGLEVKLIYKTLTILREKPGGQKNAALKITAPGQAAPATPATDAPAAGAPAPAANGNGHPANPMREKRSAIYLAQTKWVLETIVPMYVAAKVPVTANDVHSMVATLFIAETRN